MPDPEKQSLSKENLAESLIKSQPGLFVLFDKKGRIYWWNTRLEHYTHYSNDQIREMNVLDLIDEPNKEAVTGKIEETYEKGEAEIELRMKKGNGDMHFLLTGVSIELDGERYIIGTGIDISKMMKERAEKMRYFQVLENSRNEILMFDADSLKMVYVNEGARKNLGYTYEQLKSMKAYEIKPDFTAAGFREHIRPLLNREKENLKYETFHQRADGSRYDVEVNLQLDVSDNYKLLVGIALDISDRLKYERQLKASLHEKELLLKEVHHRVKNNLAIVSSLLSLQAGNARTGEVKMLLEESYSRIRAMAMIHQMLYEQDDLSRIDFNKYLRKLIDYIGKNYQDPNTETRIEAPGISFDITTAVPCALIVHELITNAHKHACPDQAQCLIKVSLTSENDLYTLVVSDNGQGLPASFDIEKSQGLGMTLIRGLTDQLSGELDVQQDGGTSFIIKFKS
ncbi:MAG: histidine kinase dimerization/phosphoacceptor domain -containing protein [Balneolales bacterium]